jgi:hypothetical protein
MLGLGLPIRAEINRLGYCRAAERQTDAKKDGEGQESA